MSTTNIARLNVLLTANTNDFMQAMRDMGKSLDKASEAMQETGKTLSKNLTAPIVAVGAALFAATVRVGNLADKLLDLEQMTGLSTNSLQEFRRVTTVAGVSQDAIADGAMQLTRRLKAVGDESTAVQGAMAKLGVQTRNTDGSLRSMDDLMPELIKSLQGVENITERNSLATEVFGRGASQLAPILGMTADQFDNLRQEAHDMGLVLGRDALQAANQFRVQFDTLKQSAAGVASEFGMAFMPVFERVVGLIQQHAIPAVRRMAEFLGNLSGPTQTVIAGLAALAAAIGPVMLGIGKLIPLLKTAFAVISANPIGILVIALAALSIAFIEAWNRSETFRNVIMSVVDPVIALAQTLRTALGSALAAVTSMFTNTFDAIFSTVSNIIGGIIDRVGRFLPESIRTAMGGFRDSLVGGVSGAVKTAQDIINELRGPSLDLGVTGSNAAARDALYGPVIEASADAGNAIKEAADTYVSSLVEGAKLNTLNSTEVRELITLQGEYRNRLAQGNLTLAERNTLTTQLNRITEASSAALAINTGELMTSRTAMGLHTSTLQLATIETGQVTRTMGQLTQSTSKTSQIMQQIGAEGMGKIGNFLSQFSPLSLAMQMLGEVFKVLQPIMDSLKAPFMMVAQILGRAVIPILQAFWPPIRALAIAMSYVAEVIFRIAGGIASAVGGAIAAIGSVIAKIPLLGGVGRSIQARGQDIQAIGAGFTQAGREMRDLRDSLRSMDLGEAEEEAGDKASQAIMEGTDNVVAAIYDTAGTKELAEMSMGIESMGEDIHRLTRPETDTAFGMAVANDSFTDRSSLRVENITIDARGTTDPESTGRSVARAFVDEIDRVLGENSLRDNRFDGMMMAT
jgi:phage-related protein